MSATIERRWGVGMAAATRLRPWATSRRPSLRRLPVLDGLPSRSSRLEPAYALWASARQPSLASRAKAGGGRRTRTFEVIRRLIYSQLPLPLGTLPRPNSIGTHPLNGGGRAMDDVNTASRWRAPGRARLWAKQHGKVNQRGPSKHAHKGPKLPESGTRDTSLL
jgi:hypothetical protein